jgi:hypothetical protein
MLNNQGYALIACNHTLEHTFVPNRCVIGAGRSIITLLHLDKQNQSTNNTGSTSNNSPTTERGNTSTDSASERDTPTEEVNSYCSVKTTNKGHVLLATAIVEVMDKAGQFIPCRALLDWLSHSLHNGKM